MKSKQIYLLVLILSLLFAVGCSNKNKELNIELNKMAYNLNQDAPAQLDENTMFIKAEVDSTNTFKYIYRIVNTDKPADLLNEMESQMKANLKEAFKLNPDLRIFTENNVIIEYVYMDEDDNVVRTITVTPQDYKN